MKKFKLLTIVAMSTMLSISSLHAIQPAPSKKTTMPMGAIFKSLDLTKEQKDSIKKLKLEMREFRKKSRAKMINRRSKRMASLIKHLSKSGFDKDAFVKTQLEEITPKLDFSATILQKTFAILTPKQREEFVKKAQPVDVTSK